MTSKTTLQKTALTVLVLAGFVGGGAYVWHEANHQATSTHEHGHGDGHATVPTTDSAAVSERGPHGGKLFRQGNFALELKIFEEGVEPQLRLYAYQDEKLIPPQQWNAQVHIQRLDTAETIRFRPEADYLLGDQVIYEPHSFVVDLKVTHASKPYTFTWTQLEGRVRLPQASINSSGLEILTVEPKSFAVSQSYSGALQLIPTQQAMVTNSSAGTIKRVFKTVGQSVRQGEVLAWLESRELISLRAQHQAALQQLQLAQSHLQREQRLWQEKVSPEQDYLNAKHQVAQAQIAVDEVSRLMASLGAVTGADYLEVRAPIGGVISATPAVAGLYVPSQQTLFEIANTRVLQAVVQVPEQQLPDIAPQQLALISSKNSSLRTTGRVQYISPTFSTSTRTGQAFVQVDNASGQWHAGQLVDIAIQTKAHRANLSVREDALQTFRDWTVVYIQVGDDFEIRPVELGLRGDGVVEVLSGLNVGQRYAAGNAYLLTAELGKAGATHDH